MTGLKLRDDACYVPTSDGIWIITPHGEVTMTGRSIFGWVDRLAPYLDGRHTLAELTAALPADRKQMAERIIGALCDRGVVVEISGETGPASRLTHDERRRYGPEIGFLGYFGPSGERGCRLRSSGERSFRAFRDTVIVLAGSGRLLAETAQAALCSGSRRLRVAAAGEWPEDPAGCGRATGRRDRSQQITRTAADLTEQEGLSELVAGAGVVVYACDRASAPDRASALDRACARAGVPFVSVILAGDNAWLGPFGQTPGGRPGWMSAWRRLCAADGAGRVLRPCAGGVAADRPASADGDPLAGAAPTVVANQLIREVVRQLSGTAPAGPPRMTRVGLASLRTEDHPFLPHPFALAAGHPDRAGLTAAVARLREGAPLDPGEFSRRIPACLQPWLGVLSEVTEPDLAQIPLAVAQVRVSDPVLLLGPRAPLPVVTGAGLSLAEARRAAVLRGLAVYGSLMVDPRRLHARGDARGRTGDPEQDLAALRAGRWSGLVWGHGLAGGRPHELAAEEAFPALRRAAPGYPPPPGAAAGYDWSEAVRNGLIGQCRRLTLAELDDGRRRFPRLEWTSVGMDAAGRRYRSMAKVIGRDLDVYDVTGSARVPTLAFCAGGVTVAYASGFSFGDALRDGLAEVLLSYQARANGEPGYAPARVPPLPQGGRLPGITGCPAWSTDSAGAAARLAQLGWKAVAVPLDHDPGVTGGILPYLVNVVVTSD